MYDEIQDKIAVEEKLLEKIETKKYKELSFNECLEILNEKGRMAFYSQMKDFKKLRRVTRRVKGKDQTFFVLKKR